MPEFCAYHFVTIAGQFHESATQNTTLLQGQVDLMLSKEAVKVVQFPDCLGHCSYIFLVPEKNEKLSLMICLKCLTVSWHAQVSRWKLAEISSAVS